MQRPWTSIGIGWLLAIVVLIVCVLVFLGVPIEVPHLAYWLIALLALALVL